MRPIVIDIPPPPSPKDETDEVRKDAVERLERVIDIQVDLINGIDDKAERTARLVAVLLGVVLSVLSFASTSDQVKVDEASTVTKLLLLVGVAFLILSTIFSIITYLSSKFRVGLRSGVGNALSSENAEIGMDEHVRLTVGAYAYIINVNKKVINTNSRRFRYSLLSLLLGILWLSFSGILFIGGLARISERILIGLVLVLSIGLSWYILTARYLTLEDVP